LILNKYVASEAIINDSIDPASNDIDYLETSIKCVELYQWLSRHFNNKHFDYDEVNLLDNKQLAIDKLNNLLSEKIVPTCSSCGCKLPDDSKFAICESCFERRRSRRGGGRPNFSRSSGDNKGKSGSSSGNRGGKPGKSSSFSGKKRPSRKRKTTK